MYARAFITIVLQLSIYQPGVFSQADTFPRPVTAPEVWIKNAGTIVLYSPALAATWRLFFLLPLLLVHLAKRQAHNRILLHLDREKSP